jgi:hypothetical protein
LGGHPAPNCEMSDEAADRISKCVIAGKLCIVNICLNLNGFSRDDETDQNCSLFAINIRDNRLVFKLAADVHKENEARGGE